jgi:uncharacterized protein YerC
MICFEADIKGIALEFFVENINILSNYATANELLKDICGVNNFFASQAEATELLEKISNNSSIVSEDRCEVQRFSNKH